MTFLYLQVPELLVLMAKDVPALVDPRNPETARVFLEYVPNDILRNEAGWTALVYGLRGGSDIQANARNQIYDKNVVIGVVSNLSRSAREADELFYRRCIEEKRVTRISAETTEWDETLKLLRVNRFITIRART